MDPGADAPEVPSSSSAAAAGAAAETSSQPPSAAEQPTAPSPPPPSTQPLSRYESQKRRDWNTFLQYLKNHKPPLTLARCSGAHVIEFLKYLDQFGKTKVHAGGCSYFGHPSPPAPCACPLKQAWGSLDALIGRLRAAYEENGGRPESNPFAARAVRIYLREVRESQAKARGIPYEKKKRKRNTNPPPPAVAAAGQQLLSDGAEGSSGGGGGESSSAAAAVSATTTTTTNVTTLSTAAAAGGSEAGEGSGAPPPEGSSTS